MIPNEKLALRGLFIWLICVLFYLYEFLLRTLLGTFQHPIMSDLKLSSFDFAILSSSAYLMVYGLMQIPVGTILSRFGIKKAMVFACMTCTVATAGFAYCDHYYTALFFRGLMGLGSSFGFISLLVAVYDWMPYKNIALYVGLSQFLGTMGPIIAAGPLNSLAHNSTISWRTLFVILSFIGIGLTCFIALIVDKNRVNQGPFIVLNKKTALKKDLFGILKEPQVWLIAVFCAFIYFSLEYLSENECKNFLLTKGFSSNFASYMISTSWFGFAIGSPLCGYYSDKISRRKPFLIFSALVTAIALIAIVYLDLSPILMSIAFLLFGIAVGASSVGIVIMGEQFRSERITMGLGINNAFTILFVSVISPCISYVLSVVAHEGHFTLPDFQKAFALIIVFPCIALIVVLTRIKETFGKSQKDNVILKSVLK